MRNRFLTFSIPIVVNSPWPGKTLTFSGKILSLARESLIGALVDDFKSVLPMTFLNKVSPVNNRALLLK